MKLFVSHFLLAISLTSTEGNDPDHCSEKIVVFGDSLSDTGNLQAITGGALPPGPPYYSGRFTNGNTWVEYLADLMNLDRPMPAYAAENAGTNFAIAGAASGNKPTTTWTPALTKSSQSLPSKGFRLQVEDFRDTTDNCNSESLFVIWVGTVDLLLLDKGPEYSVVLKHIRRGIVSLIKSGATKFVVLNIPQLKKTPAVIGKWPSLFVSDTLPRGLSNSVIAFNGELKEMLETIDSRNDGVKITYADILPLFNKAAKKPSEFGLDTEDIAKPRLNEAELFLNGKIVHQNKANTLFFDGVHPTTAFHEVLATEVYYLIKKKKNSKSKKSSKARNGRRGTNRRA